MKNVIAAVLVCFAFSPAVLVAGSGDATAGKAAYKQHCAVCHGADGTGNAALAKTMKIPDLGSKDVQTLSDADLQKVIADGKGKMPASKGLADADLHNLVAYIRTLAKK